MENINGDREVKELLEAQAHLLKYALNYMTSMSLKCAVELGIPDVISNHAKPITLADLVTTLSIPQSKSTHLYRLMRILVHSGFFSVQGDGYVLTPSSKLLVNDQKTNLSPFLTFLLYPIVVTSFLSMSAWFQGTDHSSFKTAHGMDVWDYCGQHPETSNMFNAAMASDSELVMSVMVKEQRRMFEGFKSLVDVGGGTGTTTKAISEAFPLLRCTVFDLPHVVSSLQGSKNVEYVGGNMYDSIPSAELFLLKWMMHDCDDDECLKILMRCKEGMKKEKQGKVIIIDIVLDENRGNKHESIETQLCFDMLVMVLVTGRERTEMEWKKLFVDAGFTSYKITHGLGLRSIIEVFP